MLCSIHENYGPASDTFEIVDPEPSLPAERVALLLKELVKQYVAITDIEAATLALPANEGESPRVIERIMVNIDPLRVTSGTHFNQVICEAADTLFMNQVK